jgi:hypothetical protein
MLPSPFSISIYGKLVLCAEKAGTCCCKKVERPTIQQRSALPNVER